MRKFLLISLYALFLYGAVVTFTRMRSAEMAYRFENLKLMERGLHEENIRLKALLHEELSPQALTKIRLSEPDPDQVRRIP